MFYWKVKFADGYILSQFDSEGNELILKEILGKEHWMIKNNVQTLNKFSNMFSNIERLHGRAVKVGWYAFDKTLGEKIKAKQPDFNIHLIENTEPHFMAIPDNGFAYISKEIGLDWASKNPVKDKDGNIVFDDKGNQMFVIKEPSGCQSDLYFGYLMRDGSPNGDIKHVILNVKEQS